MLGSVPIAVMTVVHVWCSSGAKVNHAVTTSVGQQHPVTPGDVERLRRVSEDADTFTMSYPIKPGYDYPNGRPPCPAGDVLNIVFKLPPTS